MGLVGIYIYRFIDDIPETCLGQFWNSYHISVSDGKGDFLHIALPDQMCNKERKRTHRHDRGCLLQVESLPQCPEVLEPQPLGNSKFGARLCES